MGEANRVNELTGMKLTKGDVAEFKNGTESAHTSRIKATRMIKQPGQAVDVPVKQRDKFGTGTSDEQLLGIGAFSGYPVTIWAGLSDKVTTGSKTEAGNAYRGKRK